MKSVDRCQTWNKLFLIFVPVFIAAIIALSGCSPTSTRPPILEHTEKQFTVATGEIYRLNIFVNEGDTITSYWKADNALYCWYTDSRGVAKPIVDYGVGSNGERVIGVREPGPEEYPCLRIADADGNYLRDESMDGSNGNEFQLEASQTGYHSICFMLFYSDENTNVVIRYSVK